MSLIAGLIAGLVIAGVYVLAGHFRIETSQLTVTGNSILVKRRWDFMV